MEITPKMPALNQSTHTGVAADVKLTHLPK